MAALALLLALATVGCGGDESGDGSLASEATGASGTVQASPPASPVALPTALDWLGPLDSLELPRDEDGQWFPNQLLQGSRTFILSSWRRPATEEEMRRTSRSLAFYDLHTGELDKFRELDPGLQAGSRENDGRFAVWVEVDRVDITRRGWRMYAMDLTTQDLWLVDEDPGIPIERPGQVSGYEPGIAVDGGRLVYWRPVVDSQGTAVYEIRLVDLESRTHTVLFTTGDLLTHCLYNPSLSGDRLVWLERVLQPELTARFLPSPLTLYLMDLSTGEVRPLVEGNAGAWPVLQGDKLLYSTDTEMHLMDPETGEDEVIWQGWRQAPEPRVLAGGLAAWVDRDTGGTAMLYDGATGEAAVLSEPFTAGMYANEQILAWLWRDRLPSGDLGDQLYLRWIDLPQRNGGADGGPES